MGDKKDLVAFEDPDHDGNSPDHHTGRECVVEGCDRPAGTAWSPHWCFACNVVRMKRISQSLSDLSRIPARRVPPEADDVHD